MRKFLLFFLMASTLMYSQQARHITANSTKLIDIEVIGSKRFTAPELVKATGLTLGQAGDVAELKAAADRLASSGMFTDVTYSYISRPEGERVKYKVNDTQQLLPAHFDNFVWLPRSELIAQLQQLEPLFRGELPNAGEMYLKVADDSKAILAKLGVNAEVQVLPQAMQEGGTLVGFLYHVEGVSIPVRAVRFPGASPEMQPVLQETAQRVMLGKDYSTSAVAAQARFDLLPQYLRHGFLRAEIASPTTALASPGSNDVDVILPVTEGVSYKLAGVNWTGNTTFPASELTKQIRVKPGEIANQPEIEENLGGISKIFGTKGYLRARLEPQYAFDDAARTVTLNVNVTEGDQYKMGELTFAGVEPTAVARLQSLWKLRTGEVYDTSYPQLFLMSIARQFDLSHLSINTRQDLQPESKTVNVTMRFTPKH